MPAAPAMNFAAAASALLAAAQKIVANIKPPVAFTPPTFGFTFSADLQKVTGETVTFGTTTKTLDITGSTFTDAIGTNDKGVRDVITVTQSRPDRDADSLLITQFKDQDGDDKYAPVLGLWVATKQQDLVGHKFTFDAAGKILTEQTETRNGSYRDDAISSNEVFQKVVLAGKTYVVETETHGAGVTFNIARDDNNDGVWSTVAAGHADASFVNSSTHALNLTLLSTYLASSSSVIG
jgi:hypothetical protein